MKSRLERYRQFIENDFIPSLVWNKDYKMNLSEDLTNKLKNKHFKRIVFNGMGCSAIVSDLIKGFFVMQDNNIEIEVINGYDIDYTIHKNIFSAEDTLVIISSYSGFSTEPIKIYEKIKTITPNIIFLTSGGKLGELGEKENVSMIYWQLRNPDRHYPLFHVPQFFSILIDICYHLGFLFSNFEKELKETEKYLQKFLTKEKLIEAKKLANYLFDKDIILIATPQIYLIFLKLFKMHLNEIAMAPAHRNMFHEFSHSEVAVCTNPTRKQLLWFFLNDNEDEYTENKFENVKKLMTEKILENKNISIQETRIKSNDFFNNFFGNLLFNSYVVYYLGLLYDTHSRDLISQSLGNLWYKK